MKTTLRLLTIGAALMSIGCSGPMPTAKEPPPPKAPVSLSITHGGGTGRALGTLVAMPDGSALLLGGVDITSGTTDISADVLRWDGAEWKICGSTQRPHGHLVAAALPDGRVLVAGGLGYDMGDLRTEIFDPATGTAVEGPKTIFSYGGGGVATATPAGNILMSGGGSPRNQSGQELVDVARGIATQLANASAPHAATSMADRGTDRAYLGSGYPSPPSVWLATWSSSTLLPSPALYHGFGACFVAGSRHLAYIGGSEVGKIAEILDLEARTWRTVPIPSQPIAAIGRSDNRVLMLSPNGELNILDLDTGDIEVRQTQHWSGSQENSIRLRDGSWLVAGAFSTLLIRD